MCQRITRKGDVVCQACNYGPIIGEVKFLDPIRSAKEPESLYSCSNCGKVMKYDEFPEELFRSWLRGGNRFEFTPSEYFWAKKLEVLFVCLGRQGISPSIKFVQNGIIQKERRIKKRPVLALA